MDKTLKLVFQHPMRPFERIDFSGLDIDVPSCESLSRVSGIVSGCLRHSCSG
ncbi:MAG: hypothetical protein HQM13_12710 [SAR324 cluster bacterium]|nr:hypothetical protein [SAR324 cluster bacterium]